MTLVGKDTFLKHSLHPRNRHQGHYDFKALTLAYPPLATFVTRSPRGDLTIDFANAEGVRALNGALLKLLYGTDQWQIPTGYLCPPIPGRSDYLHALADLLGSSNGAEIPRGGAVRVLDIGTGASLIYPIVGLGEYGWSFVGTEVDPIALASAQKIIDANPALKSQTTLRRSSSAIRILDDLTAEDQFDATICNPPFHASLAEAEEGSRRKWRNLKGGSEPRPTLNFGGQGSELWCSGGESAFVCRMVNQSVGKGHQVFWFSSLVSKDASLPEIYAALKQARVQEFKTIDMAQGQKKSRFVAWTFLNPGQRRDWQNSRWRTSEKT